jgi:hydantoinase/carbamoylase family amidase
MTKEITVSRDNIDKHFSALERIGNLGSNREDGFLRASWSDEETAAFNYIAAQARDYGLEVKEDALGNMYISMPGEFKEIVQVGSHLDTVPEGGNYDGATGIITGLEAIKAIMNSGKKISKGLELVVWRGEESSTYSVVYKGSKAAFGILPPQSLDKSFRGQTLEQAILRQDYDPEIIRKGKATLTQEDRDRIAAHIELHIEQGKVLEILKKDVGIVTSIRGPARYKILVSGEFDHSGATPMGTGYRKDANLAIAYMQVRLNELVTKYNARTCDLVQTIGIINTDSSTNENYSEVYANALTKISGFGYFTLDIRSNSKRELEVYTADALTEIKAIGERFNVDVDIQSIGKSLPIESLSEHIQNTIEQSTSDLGYSSHYMPSGAGHDAAIIAKIKKSDGNFIDTGMIFVPHDGKSHCKEEYANHDAIAKCADVLAKTLYKLAK